MQSISRMKSFVIHNKDCQERKELVDILLNKTKCHIIDPVWCPIFPVLGCILSHIKVARLGEGGYFVFEDDAVFNDEFFDIRLDTDIIYFGINGKALQHKPISCIHFWGTHALFISEKARLILLNEWEKELQFEYPKGFPAFDEILSVLIYKHNLSFKIFDCIHQRKGLVSYISGSVR